MKEIIKEWRDGWVDFLKLAGVKKPKDGDTIWTIQHGQIVDIVLDCREHWDVYHSGIRFTSLGQLENFIEYWSLENDDEHARLMSTNGSDILYTIGSYGIDKRTYLGKRRQLAALVDGFASFDYETAKAQFKKLVYALPESAKGKYFLA